MNMLLSAIFKLWLLEKSLPLKNCLLFGHASKLGKNVLKQEWLFAADTLRVGTESTSYRAQAGPGIREPGDR